MLANLFRGPWCVSLSSRQSYRKESTHWFHWRIPRSLVDGRSESDRRRRRKVFGGRVLEGLEVLCAARSGPKSSTLLPPIELEIESLSYGYTARRRAQRLICDLAPESKWNEMVHRPISKARKELPQGDVAIAIKAAFSLGQKQLVQESDISLGRRVPKVSSSVVHLTRDRSNCGTDLNSTVDRYSLPVASGAALLSLSSRLRKTSIFEVAGESWTIRE